MIKNHKRRLYIVIILFLILSFISVTYAWFTFSGMVGGRTTVDVKAWSIEFKDGEDTVNNSIDIVSRDIYPGMETVYEEITINNKGDTNALLNIFVNEARILNEDQYKVGESMTSADIIDALAHDYPFKVNVITKDNIIEPKSSSSFIISISWPADSGDDIVDTFWGQTAYNFHLEEQAKLNADPSYQMLKPIELKLTVIAEQDVKEATGYDEFYQLGQSVLIDVVSHTGCTSIGGNCIKASVIDSNSKIGDETVNLIPDVKSSYQTSNFQNYQTTYNSIVSGWTVSHRPLTALDVVKTTSKDIEQTVIKSDSTSDIIVGNLLFDSRANTIIDRTKSLSGYISYSNDKFNYLNTANCVWTNTEYNIDNGFAISQIDQNDSKMYGELKNTTCKVVPVITALKRNLTTN